MSGLKVSIVIPTYDKKDDSYLLKFIEHYPEDPAFEYIIINGHKPEDQPLSVKRNDFKVFHLPDSNRAQRLNYGFLKSMAPIVFFHHPRSFVSNEGLWFLANNTKKLAWGGFTHQFDTKSLGLKWTSWYSNNIRPLLFKILYLDHCIFFKKELLHKALPNIPIFEDTELSKILARSGPPTILPFTSETSSIRFQTNGFWKQALMNQTFKLGYHLGLSRNKMNKKYEDDLNLNG